MCHAGVDPADGTLLTSSSSDHATLLSRRRCSMGLNLPLETAKLALQTVFSFVLHLQERSRGQLRWSFFFFDSPHPGKCCSCPRGSVATTVQILTQTGLQTRRLITQLQQRSEAHPLNGDSMTARAPWSISRARATEAAQHRARRCARTRYCYTQSFSVGVLALMLAAGYCYYH